MEQVLIAIILGVITAKSWLFMIDIRNDKKAARKMEDKFWDDAIVIPGRINREDKRDE